jgi:hypothetical protein
MHTIKQHQGLKILIHILQHLFFFKVIFKLSKQKNNNLTVQSNYSLLQFHQSVWNPQQGTQTVIPVVSLLFH